MKKVLSVLIVALFQLSIATHVGGNVNPAYIHNPAQRVSDWQISLRYLEEGNKRYLEGRTQERNNVEDRVILKDGQNPFVVILTCSDSRVSPEIYFDQKLGDIFVIRNAGNIADVTALGSLEYAVEHLRVPLVVVVGHSACGAVNGALSEGEFSVNLQTIINAIRPAVKEHDNLNDAIRMNIAHNVDLIRANETVMQAGAVVMGAYYNIETGGIIFY